MPQRELNKLLSDLESELDANRDLSEEERKALGELGRRIGDALNADAARPSGREDGLIESLRAYVDRLETSHPTVTMIVGRIADVLTKMGI